MFSTYHLTLTYENAQSNGISDFWIHIALAKTSRLINWNHLLECSTIVSNWLLRTFLHETCSLWYTTVLGHCMVSQQLIVAKCLRSAVWCEWVSLHITFPVGYSLCHLRNSNLRRACRETFDIAVLQNKLAWWVGGWFIGWLKWFVTRCIHGSWQTCNHNTTLMSVPLYVQKLNFFASDSCLMLDNVCIINFCIIKICKKI